MLSCYELLFPFSSLCFFFSANSSLAELVTREVVYYPLFERLYYMVSVFVMVKYIVLNYDKTK